MTRKLRWTLVAFAFAVIAVPASRARAAQASPPPAEVTKLFQAIDDIDKLRILNPLHLTADQLDKLATTIEQSQKDFNKALSDAAVQPLSSISESILDTRTKLLAGGDIPKDFDDSVKKLQADFVAQRKAVYMKTVTKLATDIKAIYTPDQFAAATKAYHAYLDKSTGAKASGTDDQFFNLYVADTYIAFARIVPLLRDMRTAIAPDTAPHAQVPQQHASR